MKFLKLFLFISFCLPVFLCSQSEIPIGSWKSHLPYKMGKVVTQSTDKIIYATDWSIFTVDKDDSSEETLSTVEGLTETGIQTIKYDPNSQQLVIAYENSVLDIVGGNEVIPVFSIKENTSISGDKKIYDIFIDQDSYAYLATGFGIVQFDLEAYEFSFSAIPQLKFNSITRYNDFLIAGSVDGAYTFDLNSQEIPDDFGNWVLLEQANGLPVVYNAVDVEVINNQLYLVTDDEVYKSDQDFNFTLAYENTDSNFDLRFISPEQNGWMLGIRSATEKSNILFFDKQDSFYSENNACSDRINNAIQDEQGRIWVADDFNDFRYLETVNSSCSRIKRNTPNTHTASELAIKDNILYVASGGVSDVFGYLDSRAGYFYLQEKDWININQDNNNTIDENDLLNMFTIAPHPKENKLYIGSFYSGLMEHNLDTDEFQLFNAFTNNSSLGFAIGDESRTRISGLKFDSQDNLWVANHAADKPLSVLTAGGIWHSFDINSNNQVSQIAFDEADRVWLVIGGNSGGILVYDHKGTLANPNDDEQRFITSNGTAISTGLVNCVETDLSGDIWVGTAEGPVVFNCGANFLDTELCTGNTQIVTQDSIPAILLQTENIRSIAIDGANRKWFGTRNGVFVQSADVETQIFHFTKDNSPLFDDNINDIVYNDETGEMYIATDKGVISYRTASKGSRKTVHSSNVYAYPNPVREDYFGPIAISGLVRDADVKITDVSGKLIYETTALGGQAIWDGKDYNGRFAASGVYMVFSSSTDTFNDPDTHVTKILVVR